MQHAHRRLALRSPLQGGAGLLGDCEIRRDALFPDQEVKDSLWSLYLDDATLVEIMEKRLADEMAGKSSEEQQKLRKAYHHWGVPISFDKALLREARAEKLGSVIDGDRGLLRSSMKRALDTMGLVFWMLRQEQVPRKALQIFLGREVHTLQFRRPLFGVFDYLWKAVADGGPLLELNLKETEELFLASLSQPLRYTDLKAGLHEVVTASDASESGGGLVYGTKLTSEGVREAYALEEGLEEMPTEAIKATAQEEVVLVIDMFAGIGGLSQALKLAGLDVSRLVVVEKDPGCRRVNKVRFPGCDIIPDINGVTKDQIEKIMRSVPGLTGVIAGGGSPCQGLSKLSINRRHLEDPRSKLFFKLADILVWVAEVAEEMQVWHLELVENVVGDEADVQQMTEQLGWKPIRSCASGVSRVRRPRLFWCSDHPCFTRVVGPAYDEVIFEEKPEPMEKVADKGWSWSGGEADDSLRLPTFTRAIPRDRPPPAPAGLSSCSDVTKEKWKQDQMKFPPYTYAPQFLFHKMGAKAESRVASADERERLMGYPTGHTLAMVKGEIKTKAQEQALEVQRQAALGNAFHAVHVACILDLLLWSMHLRTDPVTPEAILKRWHDRMEEPVEEVGAPPVLSDGEGDANTLAEKEAEEAVSLLEPSGRTDWLRLASHKSLLMPDAKALGIRLVHQYLRRMEFRGSDVRLDLGVIFRPDSVIRTSINPKRWVWKTAQSYPWRGTAHINVLELMAILRGLEWRARSASFHSCRFLHLSDSQICLSVLAKGRSSSRQINRILRKINSLCVALNLLPLWAWVASRLNPADAPSRKYAEDH
eukprot:Skav210467  [mRNA]  locus=scaffold1443:165052:167511:- [translate_table: standard]